MSKKKHRIKYVTIGNKLVIKPGQIWRGNKSGDWFSYDADGERRLCFYGAPVRNR